MGCIVRAGARNVAFGLIWSTLPGVGSMRAEIRALAEEHEATEYVALPIDDRVLVGLLGDAAIAKGASRRRSFAAAAALASVHGDALENAMFGVALPNANGRVSLIGFRNGAPLVGFDRVVAPQDVDAVVADYLHVLGDLADTATFYGQEAIFGDRDCEPFGLGWFASADKSRIARTALRATKPPVRLILAAVVLAAVVAYGVHAYEKYRLDQARTARVAVLDPDQLYERSVETALSAAGYPAVEAAWQLIESINALPMYHRGWKLTEADCEPGTCVLTWTNEDGGTFQTFSAGALPGVSVKSTEYAEGLTAIKTTVEYPLSGKQGVAAQTLPTEADYLMTFGSRAQTLKDIGVPVTLHKAGVVGLPPTPAGQAPITEHVLKHPVREGQWSMTGDWIYHDALRDLPLNMTLGKLTLALRDETISMTANGKYYVKK